MGALFPIFLNSWVHIIMYSYYLAANIFGPDVMKHLTYIKKSITIIQMVQFVCLLTQAIYTLGNCEVPLVLRAYYCIVVSVIFYGFYDFYKKAYVQKSRNDKLEK